MQISISAPLPHYVAKWLYKDGVVHEENTATPLPTSVPITIYESFQTSSEIQKVNILDIFGELIL